MNSNNVFESIPRSIIKLLKLRLLLSVPHVFSGAIRVNADVRKTFSTLYISAIKIDFRGSCKRGSGKREKSKGDVREG